ncbi:ABC transporter permease [Spiractinospora alimapuensis]|uniref:ABC transporter permease n=1 Tax=Spiractinospora alimapuensis TaxID=2820884 RepID=UPI001F38BB4C|nr:ABC transporter permease [Spiractinospora alimapuensis]QVQ53898.1 ABC transporter permease [Spiractinospora alimapuensis]
MSVATSPRGSAPPTGARGTRRGRDTSARALQRWPVVVGPLVLLLAWEIASRTEVIPSIFYPAPTTIATELPILFDASEDGLRADLITTVRRLLLTAGLSAVFGIGAGLVISVSRWLKDGVEPVLAFLYPIPTLLFLPLLSFVLGRGEFVIILTAVVTPMIILTLYTAAGVRGIAPVLLEVAHNYGARGPRLFLRVLLPGALTSVIAGFRIALGYALITVVAVEMVGANDGLGQVLWASWQVLAVTDMYVALVAVAVLGLLSSVGFGLLANRLVPWSQDRPSGGKR